MNKNYFILLCFQLIPFSDIFAQTCCSGGVPLSGNIGLPISTPKSLQFSLNYDLNVLKDLKEGSGSLDDNSRTRKTHSVLLSIGYTLSKSFSFDVFTSYVRQERTITNPGLPEDFSETNGLGDLVLLLKYKLPIKNNYTDIVIGAGPKLPTGASDLKNNRGFTLNADLQPGSGALDFIFWTQITNQVKFRKSMSIGLTSVYSQKGKNDSYFGTQTYQFGNETQITLSISDRIAIQKLIFDPSISFRYRNVTRDKNEGFELPNTGGNWLFVLPGINNMINDKISINARVQIPIYAKVDGIQLSPSYRVNFGVLFNISSTKNTFNPSKINIPND